MNAYICENFYELRNIKKESIYRFLFMLQTNIAICFVLRKTRGSAWCKMFCNPG